MIRIIPEKRSERERDQRRDHFNTEATLSCSLHYVYQKNFMEELIFSKTAGGISPTLLRGASFHTRENILKIISHGIFEILKQLFTEKIPPCGHTPKAYYFRSSKVFANFQNRDVFRSLQNIEDGAS